MYKIYLGDLIYDTVKTNFVVPLNIAYIAAYAKEKFGPEVDIQLFKYPTTLEKALKEDLLISSASVTTVGMSALTFVSSI